MQTWVTIATALVVAILSNEAMATRTSEVFLIKQINLKNELIANIHYYKYHAYFSLIIHPFTYLAFPCTV